MSRLIFVDDWNGAATFYLKMQKEEKDLVNSYYIQTFETGCSLYREYEKEVEKSDVMHSQTRRFLFDEIEVCMGDNKCFSC